MMALLAAARAAQIALMAAETPGSLLAAQSLAGKTATMKISHLKPAHAGN